MCTKSDPECQLTARITDPDFKDENMQPQGRTITNSQAEAICKVHVDTYMGKTRRAPYQRSASMNNTISDVLTACIVDLTFTGQPEAAQSSINVLMMEELTSGATSISSIETTIQEGVDEALIVLNNAVEEAQAEVPQLLGLTTTNPPDTTTTTTVTTTQEITTTTVPVASFKCGVYQDMYIQTWHPSNQASPPSRTCSGNSALFELVRNKYVRYTLRTSGSTIDELTLVLFNETSSNGICTVSVIGDDAGGMDCEQNGINPSLIKTATHETLTVYYPKANFTTIVTRDIGINVGRFNINIYQSPELAVQSTGICNLLSLCNGSGHVQSNKRFRRQKNE